MSDNSSNPQPNNTGDGKKLVKADPKPEPETAQVLASVQSELEKSGLPPQKAAAVSRTIMTTIEMVHFGPLPPVHDYAGYEQVCPGAARDILEMAKSAQRHHQSMERAEVYGDLSLKIIGNFTALAIVVAMLVAALYAATNGHDALAGIIASGTGLSMVAGVFIRNRMNKKQKPTPPPEPRKKDKSVKTGTQRATNTPSIAVKPDAPRKRRRS